MEVLESVVGAGSNLFEFWLLYDSLHHVLRTLLHDCGYLGNFLTYFRAADLVGPADTPQQHQLALQGL